MSRGLRFTLVLTHTLVSINVAIQRWARLVPGWVTVFGEAKLSRYVTSHPGQLSLAIPLWVSVLSTSLGWEGNRRSGVALAVRHRQ